MSRVFRIFRKAYAIIVSKHTNKDGKMNKIAVYLNEHLQGEVTSSKAMRRRYSRDGSVLSITPEIIVFPRITNDIRKVARFSWQLAEKGHAIDLTVRGAGGDTTGGAIGKGVLLCTTTYLHNILTIVPKNRLVHLQPGVTFEVLNEALKWQGLAIPNAPSRGRHVTVGGAIASNILGEDGEVSRAVEKLEVVLANGDLIETARISKGELSKKLGLQTFEGEIYRKLEGLLEDNEALITRLANDRTPDNSGYKSVSMVKARDGSFDLTPLFVGSQGTLGVISEIVLRAEYHNSNRTMIAVVVKDTATARDISDKLLAFSPSALRTIDGELFRRSAKLGTNAELLGSVESIGAVIYVELNEFNAHVRLKKLKKIKKLMVKLQVGIVDSTDHHVGEFDAVKSIGDSLRRSSNDDDVALPIIDGAYIPSDRREAFLTELDELAAKCHIELPLVSNILTGTYDVFPLLKLDVVGDKQKLFRLLTDYAALVVKCDGALASNGAEGRLKANAVIATMEDDEVKLYEDIRAIFDPFGTMNPGVKQKSDVRALVSALRSSFDTSDFAA
jgi:FAD/FMN-containing dehydrogenase